MADANIPPGYGIAIEKAGTGDGNVPPGYGIAITDEATTSGAFVNIAGQAFSLAGAGGLAG